MFEFILFIVIEWYFTITQIYKRDILKRQDRQQEDSQHKFNKCSFEDIK